MSSVLHVRLLTPERLVLEEEAAEVVAPGTVGEFGILPNHTNFASSLEAGRLILNGTGGEPKVIAVFGGYLEVADDIVTILADGAELAGEVDTTKAREELAAAEVELAELNPGSAGYRKAQDTAARARARLAATGGAR